MATTKTYTDFELSLLIYGITLSDKERKNLSKMVKVSEDIRELNVVQYVKDKDIFIVNETLKASDRYNSGSNELEKQATESAPEYVYKAFSSTTVILKAIKTIKAFKAVNMIIDSLTRLPTFTSSFKNEMYYNQFLNGDILEFDDELHLQDYVFYVLKTAKINESSLLRLSGYFSGVKTVSERFKNAGWTVNGMNPASHDDYIQMVVEKDNWRFFIMKESGSYSGHVTGLMHSNNPHYSYIDAERQFFNVDSFDLNKPVNNIGQILNGEDKAVLEEYFKKKDTIEPVTDALLDSLKNAKLKKDNFAKRQVKLSEALKKKVEYKLKLIEKGTESFKLNEIEYTKDSIEYSNQILEIVQHSSGPDLNGIGYLVLNSLYREAREDGGHYYYRHRGERFKSDFLKKQSSEVDSISDISFDVIYDEFMGYIELYGVKPAFRKNRLGGFELNIGDVNVKFTTKVLTNKNNVKSVSLYLNDIKITKDDLFYCIHQAISYDSQDKYNNFLKSVSYTSLKVHRLTKKGVYLNFHDYIMQKNIKLTIPVTRKKNKNFLVINGKEKPIRKTASVLSLNKRSTILDIIKALTDQTVIDGLTYDDLQGFIDNGQKAYDELVEKKDKLIKSTMEALGITKHESVILNNGNTLYDVYYVQGALRSYYVEAKDPYKIYSEKEGRYICMLDKTPYVSPEVKLISRFYALKNDSVISKEVATLDF